VTSRGGGSDSRFARPRTHELEALRSCAPLSGGTVDMSLVINEDGEVLSVSLIKLAAL